MGFVMNVGYSRRPLWNFTETYTEWCDLSARDLCNMDFESPVWDTEFCYFLINLAEALRCGVCNESMVVSNGNQEQS